MLSTFENSRSRPLCSALFSLQFFTTSLQSSVFSSRNLFGSSSVFQASISSIFPSALSSSRLQFFNPSWLTSALSSSRLQCPVVQVFQAPDCLSCSSFLPSPSRMIQLFWVWFQFVSGCLCMSMVSIRLDLSGFWFGSIFVLICLVWISCFDLLFHYG